MEKRQVGALGEKIALSLLRSKGYKILKKNFHTRFGEIDIVAQDKETLVFVEVKTRHGRAFGLPEESVGKRKIRHLEKAGQIFRSNRTGLPEAERIDVVSVELDQNDQVIRKELIKNASQ